MLFSPAAAFLVPTEQLVLTTIRQEASELQDPGQVADATMRACLTDRFEKSEFARIRLDDAPSPPLSPPPICVQNPKVHAAMRNGLEQVSPNPRPSRATMSCYLLECLWFLSEKVKM